ncbi:hypothetical protein [Hymenobacter antarcticus]|uniref:Uncharacterized protein n=1 Tax=Hymenobacter antarcticus TaxID=486270 RepID=A0ABP7PCQ9_9BACT
MPFNGTEGKAIELSTAAQFTQNYREANPDPGTILGCFLGKNILNQLLGQSGCEGIRFYYGLNGTTPELVAVGADSEENDQLGIVSGVQCIIADEGVKCPPNSSQTNPLNTTPQQNEEK